MSNKPPKIVVPGLNRGAGVPPGYVLGRLPGTGQGPAQLLPTAQLQKLGVATTVKVTGAISQSISVVQSEIVSLSTAVSSAISGDASSIVSLSSAVSKVDNSQSTSLSQISSSLSGAISSTSSLSTGVSTVVSGSISAVNSRVDSLSTAVGGGGGTPGGSSGQIQYNNAGAFGGFTASGDVTIVPSTGVATIKTNVALAGNPTTTTQAAGDNSTKIATTAYTDTAVAAAIAGLSWKQACVVATTANITLTGEQTIDGVLTSASRVLVKNQSTASGNGIYVSAAGAWARSTDMTLSTEFPGAAVFIEQGSAGADTQWVCTNTVPPTVGVTSITFAQFSSGGGSLPLVIGFILASGATGTNVGPELCAPRAGSVTKCKVVTKASDASTDLSFRIKQNGTDVFSSDPTVSHGTSGGTVSTFTSLTSSPLAIAADDVFTLDVLTGTATWQATIQLE